MKSAPQTSGTRVGKAATVGRKERTTFDILATTADVSVADESCSFLRAAKEASAKNSTVLIISLRLETRSGQASALPDSFQLADSFNAAIQS